MGQHIVLMVLMVGIPSHEAQKRVSEIYQEVITPASTKLGLVITFYPIHEQFYNEFIENVNGLKISYKLSEGAKPGKGFNVTRLINGANQLPIKPDYIVYCDGSGRIPFKYCLALMENLQKKDISCIFAHRTPWRGGITQERQVIEEFESNFVCKHFKIKHTQDFQCGLWSLKYPDCSGMQINCIGYELELNVACEALKKSKKIGILEIPIRVNDTSKSQFKKDDYSINSPHFQKAYFLYKYFNLSKEKLVESAVNYNATAPSERRLSEEYLSMLDQIEDGVPKPPNIIKL